MNNSENGKEDEALKKAALEADASSKDITENKETPKVYNFQKRKKPITPADPAPKEEKEAPKEEDTLSNPLGGVKSEKPVQEEAKKEEPKETKPQTESPVQEEKPLPVTKEESPTPKEVEEPLPKCPACGEELPKKGLKFCPFCGKNLVEPVLKKEEPKAKAKLHCNDCGKDIYQGNMRFCPYCGSSDLTRLEEKPEAVVKPVSSPTPAPSPAVIPTPLASAPKPPSEARHCPKCGRPLPLDFVGEYCPYCGGASFQRSRSKKKNAARRAARFCLPMRTKTAPIAERA
jgi:rRNA maturation endonuclease Nob1